MEVTDTNELTFMFCFLKQGWNMNKIHYTNLNLLSARITTVSHQTCFISEPFLFLGLLITFTNTKFIPPVLQKEKERKIKKEEYNQILNSSNICD